MKSICLVNGSLRGEQSSSLEFLNDISRRLPDAEFNKVFLTVRAKVKESYPEDMLKSIASADAIIFVFPLHNYGIPGALMRLLEDYYRYRNTGNGYNPGTKVYMMVNCAFPRPGETTGEAIRVMRNFCRRLSFDWRFAVCIGTGPVVVMTKKVPFLYPELKRAYAAIVTDIRGVDKVSKDYLIRPVIPEGIIAMIKRYYEKKGRMIEPDKKPQPNAVNGAG